MRTAPFPHDRQTLAALRGQSAAIDEQMASLGPTHSRVTRSKDGNEIGHARSATGFLRNARRSAQCERRLIALYARSFAAALRAYPARRLPTLVRRVCCRCAFCYCCALFFALARPIFSSACNVCAFVFAAYSSPCTNPYVVLIAVHSTRALSARTGRIVSVGYGSVSIK